MAAVCGCVRFQGDTENARVFEGYWQADYTVDDKGNQQRADSRDYMYFHDGALDTSYYQSTPPYRTKVTAQYKIEGDRITVTRADKTWVYRFERTTDNPGTKGMETWTLNREVPSPYKIVIFRIEKSVAENLDKLVPMKQGDFKNPLDDDLFAH